MTKNHLPQWIEPRKLAESRTELVGTLPIAKMLRLVELLASATGEVMVNLQFDRDEQGLPFLKGNIEVQVELTCQRCLENYQQAIISIFMLSPVTNDKEAAMLPNPYEALLVENSVVELAAIVEDEILLSLPVIAKHAPEQCKVATSYSTDSSISAEKISPFSVLASVKINKQ